MKLSRKINLLIILPYVIGKLVDDIPDAAHT
jgi:hypothetical protein